MNDKSLDLAKLGHHIRYYRKGKGWSLSELAEVAGVSKAYISDVENAAAGKPNIQYIYSLAMALDVSLDQLVDGPNAKKTSSAPRGGPAPLPPGLEDLLKDGTLTEDDVEVLAKVNFRGERPKDKDGWRFLLEAIKMSSQRKSGG
jgi:transcriptional regulator with XRE-family HTH domain